jgi:hypothetical protein
LRHKNWLIAGRDKNQPIDGCLQFLSSSKLQYRNINHSLGCVRFMQLSSSSKTAIQKNQSFFGVCEVCAQLSSSKTAIQKNQLFFGGLWGLCKGG